MRFIGIIPARYNSARLPSKPLADICGKPMIQHVYERVRKVLDEVYVATDSKLIFDTVVHFGGKAIRTPLMCNSGTDRCYYAYLKIKKKSVFYHDDVIINIQGDQPLLQADHINTLIDLYRHKHTHKIEINHCIMTTIAFKQDEVNCMWKDAYPDRAFVTFDKDHNALYFSRFVIPYCTVKIQRRIYQHIGIYGYSFEVLKRFCYLGKSELEEAEGLEQNRWLEEGYRIKVGITEMSSMSVDTEYDLKKVRAIMEIENKMKES